MIAGCLPRNAQLSVSPQMTPRQKAENSHRNTKFIEGRSCKFLWLLCFCGFSTLFTGESQMNTDASVGKFV